MRREPGSDMATLDYLINFIANAKLFPSDTRLGLLWTMSDFFMRLWRGKAVAKYHGSIVTLTEKFLPGHTHAIYICNYHKILQ